MVRFAVIEDTVADAAHALSLIRRYAEEKGVEAETKHFSSALKFLDAKEKFDVILLDIMMPGVNGMEMAEELRTFDSHTAIIFITTMAQYAIAGYGVEACDFLLKPVAYERFSRAMDKAMQIVRRKTAPVITIRTHTKLISLELESVSYIEVIGHSIRFHTKDGEVETKGTLKDLLEKLEDYGFSRANNYALVNLSFVRSIDNDTVLLKNGEIELSRRRKSAFIEDYLKYTGDLLYD